MAYIQPGFSIDWRGADTMPHQQPSRPTGTLIMTTSHCRGHSGTREGREVRPGNSPMCRVTPDATREHSVVQHSTAAIGRTWTSASIGVHRPHIRPAREKVEEGLL